jgi:hypothetical protein
MTMALGDADTIMDGFISRNLGTSGLASRKIQQNDINDNVDLVKQARESQATLENQKQQINSDFLKKVAITNRASTRIGGTLRQGTRADSEFDPTQPSAFLNIYGDENSPAMSMGRGQSGQTIRDAKGRAFRLTFSGGGNAEEAKDFGGVGELLDYLQDPRFKDTQVRLAGTPSLIDDNERNMLTQAGITPISTDIARKVVGSWPKVGFPVDFPMRIGGIQKEASAAPTLKPSVLHKEVTPGVSSRVKRTTFNNLDEILTSLGPGYRV